MSRAGRSERALRKDVDRLARSRVERPIVQDRVIVPFSYGSTTLGPIPPSMPTVRPIEQPSERVGAGVHIVNVDTDKDLSHDH